MISGLYLLILLAILIFLPTCDIPSTVTTGYDLLGLVDSSCCIETGDFERLDGEVGGRYGEEGVKVLV